MVRMSNLNIRPLGLTAFLGFAFATQALAGGFFLTLGNPEASSDPNARGAFVTVRPDGCGYPAAALLTAKAEGIVDGQRRSAPLKLKKLSAPGAYAVPPAWPAEGTWVVSITGRYFGRATGAVIPITADGFRRELAKILPHAPTDSDITAALENTARAGL